MIPRGRDSTNGPEAVTPRRVRGGRKLKMPIDQLGSLWHVRDWLNLMNRMFGSERLEQGCEYARAGQTVSLEVLPGVVNAAVQGRRRSPYKMQMQMRRFQTSEWERLIDAMAGQAIYSAAMLTGELPGAAEELFSVLRLHLVPADPRDVIIQCDCATHGPCKHAAAVGYLLAERWNRTPLEVLSARGMTSDDFLERLRQRRAVQVRGVSSAHVDPFIPATRRAAPPIEDCIDDFWHASPEWDELRFKSGEGHPAHALLRRLGPSPLKGRFPIAGLLASIYDEVSAEVVRMRDVERTDSPD